MTARKHPMKIPYGFTLLPFLKIIRKHSNKKKLMTNAQMDKSDLMFEPQRFVLLFNTQPKL